MISVVTPVFKESFTLLQSSVEHLLSFKHISEIIIVTTPTDPMAVDTKRLMDRYASNSRVLNCVASEPGRARQMNQGAKSAASEKLLFIHADTQLPAGADEMVLSHLSQSAWGRFDLKLDNQQPIFKVISWFINKRSAMTHICTGDQALFMTRRLYDQVGGFPQQQLMEDIEFSSRAKKISLPVVIKKPVITSARRWQHYGVIKTIVLMWRLRAMYWFGVPADKLARLYRQAR